MLKLIQKDKGENLVDSYPKAKYHNEKQNESLLSLVFHDFFNKKTLKQIGLDIIKLNLLFVSKMLLIIGFYLSNTLILKSI